MGMIRIIEIIGMMMICIINACMVEEARLTGPPRQDDADDRASDNEDFMSVNEECNQLMLDDDVDLGEPVLCDAA